MRVPRFKSDLREPFQRVTLLPVILDTVFRVAMIVITAPNPKPVLFGIIAILAGKPAENVMPFKVYPAAAEIASGFALLHNAFAGLPHLLTILSTSSSGTVGMPCASAS